MAKVRWIQTKLILNWYDYGSFPKRREVAVPEQIVYKCGNPENVNDGEVFKDAIANTVNTGKFLVMEINVI